MLAEVIMGIYGWDEVWAFVGDPENPPPNARRLNFLSGIRDRGFYVGVLTGPDRDMVCVRKCEDQTDAVRFRSPPGRTILDATLRSLVVRWSTDLAHHLQEASARDWARTHRQESTATHDQDHHH